MKLSLRQRRELFERCQRGKRQAAGRLWNQLAGQYDSFLGYRHEIGRYGCTIGRIGTSFTRDPFIVSLGGL